MSGADEEPRQALAPLGPLSRARSILESAQARERAAEAASGVLFERAAASPSSAWARRWSEEIPARFLDARIEDFTEPTAGILRGWSDDPAGRNLLILGPVGVGKTHAAIAAVRAAFARGVEIGFFPIDELLDQLRPGGREGALYELAAIRHLVVDDLGAERRTEWTIDRVYALLNRKWLEQTEVIATSNLPPDRAHAPEGYEGETLEEALGARAYSRLVGSGAVVLRLTGHDRRRSR